MIAQSARAKINLSLHVVARRADGYHDLDSLVVFAGVGDELAVTTADDGPVCAIDGPFAGKLAGVDGEDNIIVRAARALAEAAGVRPALRFQLTKNLPVAAGIGGGSADAAAALRASRDLLGLDLDDDALAKIGATLGADVPVCLSGVPARMSGIGHSIEPLACWPALPAVLVNPNRPVNTADVFRAHAVAGGPRSGAFAATPFAASIPEALAVIGAQNNDLTDAARALEPAIGTALDALAGTAGCEVARMSGSGATCLGLFKTDESASSAAREIAVSQPNWWVKRTRLSAA